MVPTCPPSSIYHRFLTRPTSIFAIPYSVFQYFSKSCERRFPSSKIAQNSSPNTSKMLPRASQDLSKRPRERSRRSQDASSNLQDHPNDSQKSPKRLQEASKRLQEASQRLPRNSLRSQRAPSGLQKRLTCLPGDSQSTTSQPLTHRFGLQAF